MHETDGRVGNVDDLITCCCCWPGGDETDPPMNMKFLAATVTVLKFNYSAVTLRMANRGRAFSWNQDLPLQTHKHFTRSVIQTAFQGKI